MKFSKITTILSAVVFTMILTSVSYSQTSLGVEGGLNLSNINITGNAQTSNRTGLMIGGFADLQFSNYVGIRPGLRYVMKGYSTQSNGITTTEKFSYLEVPALLKVSFPLSQVKPYIVAGPTMGIQLSATEDQTDGQNFASNDIGNLLESIDFGLFFGSGIEFHVANKTEMFVGGGYSLGLTNILKTQNANVSFKNTGIQFTVGAKFHL